MIKHASFFIISLAFMLIGCDRKHLLTDEDDRWNNDKLAFLYKYSMLPVCRAGRNPENKFLEKCLARYAKETQDDKISRDKVVIGLLASGEVQVPEVAEVLDSIIQLSKDDDEVVELAKKAKAIQKEKPRYELTPEREERIRNELDADLKRFESIEKKEQRDKGEQVYLEMVGFWMEMYREARRITHEKATPDK